MTDQLSLKLAIDPASDAENFLVSPCNANAVKLVRDWPRWPGRACVICGPEGSGKSHLAAIWRDTAGARIVSAGAIAAASPLRGPLALEDVDRAPLDERAFFHLLNQSRELGFDLLLTARTPPGEWPALLPDLRSRFRALPFAAIGAPDDDLLRLLLVKHFADKQVPAPPDVIDYLVKRMERSASEAGALTAALDEAALASKTRVTRALARKVLSGLPRYPEGADDEAGE